MFHEQGDQQAADTAVAVQEGMDGFKLDVGQSRADQGRQRVIPVHPAVQIRERFRHGVRRERDIDRVSGVCAADPVLRCANCTGRFVGSPHSMHQHFMGFPEQPHGQGHTPGVHHFATGVGQLTPGLGNQIPYRDPLGSSKARFTWPLL